MSKHPGLFLRSLAWLALVMPTISPAVPASGAERPESVVPKTIAAMSRPAVPRDAGAPAPLGARRIVEPVRACVMPRATAAHDCFSKADNAALPFHVFQTSATPAGASKDICDSATSPYFPGTDFIGGKGAVKDQDPRYASFYLHWINRCQYLRGITRTDEDCRFIRNKAGDAIRVTTKGNSYEDIEPFAKLKDQMRAAFSTYAKADGCSLLQEMQLVKRDDRDIDARAARAGLELYRDADRSKAILDKRARDVVLADGTPWRYLVDVCVLPTKGAAAGFSGIGLDYEVNDNRSKDQAEAFIGEYAAIAHEAGKKVILMINPLPRVASGVDADNAAKVLDLVDYIVLPASNGASPGNKDVGNKVYAAKQTIMQGYEQQLSVLTQGGRLKLGPAQRRHIVWMAPLYAVSLDEAKRLHDVVRDGGYAGLNIFRNYQSQGGACSREVNQLTACLTLGACDGKFGADRR